MEEFELTNNLGKNTEEKIVQGVNDIKTPMSNSSPEFKDERVEKIEQLSQLRGLFRQVDFDMKVEIAKSIVNLLEEIIQLEQKNNNDKQKENEETSIAVVPENQNFFQRVIAKFREIREEIRKEELQKQEARRREEISKARAEELEWFKRFVSTHDNDKSESEQENTFGRLPPKELEEFRGNETKIAMQAKENTGKPIDKKNKDSLIRGIE